MTFFDEQLKKGSFQICHCKKCEQNIWPPNETCHICNEETEFSLNGGYFVMDGLALGLVIDYSSSKTEIEGADDQETSLMTYGFMARYYIGESGLWGQGSYAMGTQDNGGDDTNISGITLSVGYAWYLSDNISINPTIGYNMMNSEANDVEMKMGGLAGSIGIAIHL